MSLNGLEIGYKPIAGGCKGEEIWGRVNGVYRGNSSEELNGEKDVFILEVTFTNVSIYYKTSHMKKYSLPLLLLLFGSMQFVFSQSIATDSRGKDVFNFYTTKTLSLPISSSNSSIKVSYNFPWKGNGDTSGVQAFVQSFYKNVSRSDTSFVETTVNGNKYLQRQLTQKNFLVADSGNFTVAKSHSINVGFNASNIGKNLAQLFKSHPSFGVSIGFSKNIDMFNNWDQIKTLVLKPYTYAISLSINRDNSFIYDTINKTETRKTPITYGLTYEGTYYPLYGLFISFSLTYEKGWNLSDLKNYQKNKPIYSNQSIISLGDFVGKLGDLKNEDIGRIRISFPIFTDAFKAHTVNSSTNFWSKISDLCVIPYFSLYGEINSTFSNEAGFFVDLLSKRFSYKNGQIISAGGLGVDWIKGKNGWSKGNVFASGSIDIVTLFHHAKPMAASRQR